MLESFFDVFRGYRNGTLDLNELRLFIVLLRYLDVDIRSRGHWLSGDFMSE